MKRMCSISEDNLCESFSIKQIFCGLSQETHTVLGAYKSITILSLMSWS